MALPEITYEQRMEGLAKAMESRRAIVELRERISNGEIGIEDAMKTETGNHMRVIRMLTAISGVGKRKAQLFMEANSIAPNRRVSGLGVRQRDALIKFANHYMGGK